MHPGRSLASTFGGIEKITKFTQSSMMPMLGRFAAGLGVGCRVKHLSDVFTISIFVLVI
jgi:hypothetical protein